MKEVLKQNEILNLKLGSKFLLLIKKLTQSTTNLKFGVFLYRKNEIIGAVADNTKLLSLGWRQQYSFIEGHSKIIASSNSFYGRVI